MNKFICFLMQMFYFRLRFETAQMKKSLLIILSLISLLNSVKSQCLISPVTLSARLNSSSLIIEGKVLSQKSFWNAEHNYVYTSNLIDVYKVFKGASVSFQLEIITEGGEMGLFKQVVEPSLQLNVGQTGIFTLNNSSHSSLYNKLVYSAYADVQGFIRYDEATNSARDAFNDYPSIDNFLYPLILQTTGTNLISLQSKPNANSQKVISGNSIVAVTGIAPTNITAGTASTLTITGTGFGAVQGTSFVEFPDADAGAGYVQPHSTQYLSWSATQIVVQVPTRTTSGGTLTTSGTAGTGQIRVNVAGSPTLSAQTLTVNYGHLNVYYFAGNAIYNTRHVDLNGLGGISWQMFSGFDAMAAPKAAFQRAFQSWRCATLINWSLGLPVATNTIAFDAVSVIRFDIGPELPAGVLGRCTSYFSGCITGTVVNFYVSELDICFDDATNWQYGPALAAGAQYDFESVVLHELGHGHQLSHVINNLDVMHYSIANASNKRALNVDDVNGGNAVMTRNLSGGVCLKPVMVAISPTNCAAGQPTAAFNIAPSNTICVGQLVTLTDASLGSPTSWLWTMTGGAPNTATTQNTSTSYAAPGIYSITLVAINGFGSSAPLTKTVAVVPTPTVTVSSASMCSGGSATLTAAGALSFTWNPGSLTGTTQVLSPASTTIYTVTGANGTCTNSATGTLTVTPTPTLTVPTATICTGSTATITASGATTYTWNPGALVGATQNLNPAITTTYTVTGSSAGCSSVKNTTVTVVANPTVNVAGTNTICSGISTTLTASGAVTYTWNPGGVTGAVQTFTPASTTIYSVTGSNGTCANIKTYTVTVNATPTIAVASTTICNGSSTTLTASGATTYTWIPGGATGATQTYTPLVTTIYTVTGTTGVCSSGKTVTVTVLAIPSLTITNPSPICAGNSIILSAAGATTYTWIPGGATGAVQTFTPLGTTNYTVTGSNGTCSGIKTSLVIVNPNPTVTAASGIGACTGSNACLIGGGAAVYSWAGPCGNSSALQSPCFPSSVACACVYTLTGTSAAGCSNTATTCLNVFAQPTVNTITSNTLLCIGQSATLTASGAVSYTWTPGGAGVSIVISPTVTTTYTASGTSVAGCVGNNFITQNVSTCAGISPLSNSNSQLKIYPNPTQGIVTIAFGEIYSGKLTLYNALGQEILNKYVSEIEFLNLDLSTYAKGIYLIKLKSESGKERILKIIRD